MTALLHADDFHFSPENKRKLCGGGGYPRLYALKDNTWLLGYDNGRINVRRSFDE